MLKQFAQKIESFKRLIEDSQSASFRHSEMDGGASVRFLLAVSGGMDSMCLLDLFSQVVPVEDFAVAHCNFSLRGEESDGDQALVEARAMELGAEIFVKRFDTVAFARERGISIEMAARELRYGWFAEICQEHRFDAVVVAHNANDNAETLVLNLLRGTGLNGLHGIAEVQGGWMFGIPKAQGRADCCLHWPPPTAWAPPQPAAAGCSLQRSTGPFANRSRGCEDANSDNQTVPQMRCPVVRPLVGVTRKQIEGYVMAHQVSYRNDRTNFESDYKRNRIRNEVFPIFEKVNPSFVKTLNREIGYFAEAGSIVEDWCKAQLSKVIVGFHHEFGLCRPEQSEESLSINLPALLSTDHWRYLLYYILQPYGFNSATLESLEALLESDRTVSGKRFESSTHVLYTERDSLVVRPIGYTEMLDHSLSDNDVIMVVRGDGIYNFNGVRWQVKVVERTPDFALKQPVGSVIMDADKMAFPFVCRPWRQGDWFVPLGLKGRKKISDLFVDLKFGQADKAKALMLVDCRGELAEQQHVAGVLGYRIDDHYKVDATTKTIILIKILDNTDAI